MICNKIIAWMAHIALMFRFGQCAIGLYELSQGGVTICSYILPSAHIITDRRIKTITKYLLFNNLKQSFMKQNLFINKEYESPVIASFVTTLDSAILNDSVYGTTTGDVQSGE